MHDIPHLDSKGLRQFGLVTGSIVALLFGLFFPWLLESPIPVWPWIVAGVLGIWALLFPDSLKPVYRGWMAFGLLLSRITTPVIMGAVFFLLFVPIALVMRLAGRDTMARRFATNSKTYRVSSEKAQRESMERPF